MKTCPECNRPANHSMLYCTACGTDLRKMPGLRTERILFVLTPFFLILATIAACVEAEAFEAIDTGLHYGGSLALIYLFAAMLLLVATFVFKLPAQPQSYRQAGITTVSIFVALILLALQISELQYASPPIEHLQYQLSPAETLLIVLLPLFIGLLTTVTRAHLLRFADHFGNSKLTFLYKHALILAPVALWLAVMLIDQAQPAGKQTAIRARILYELQAIKPAARLIDQELEKNDDSAALHFLKALIILDFPLQSGLPDQAIMHLQRANELQPGSAACLYRLSAAYDRGQNTSEAITVISQATAAHPKNASLWQYQGDLSFKYGDGPGSVTAYKKAVELQPNNPVLLNNLAYTMLELNSELPQALELARLSVKLLPDHIFNLDTLAWAYYLNKQYSEAVEIMSLIFAQDSEISPEIDFHYARILQAQGLLTNPTATYDRMLARPEIAANHQLFRQIYQARNEADQTNSSAQVNNDATPADNPAKPETQLESTYNQPGEVPDAD